MTIVKDTGCPSCISIGRDSTRNHLMLFQDGGGHCNRCGYTTNRESEVVNPGYLDIETVDNRSDMLTFDEIQNLPIHKLEARGIDKDVAEWFGVRTYYNPESGEQAGYCYPVTKDSKVISYRVRQLPKTFLNINEGGSTKGIKKDLIGQSKCQKGGKKLLITGGQDDMLAAFQMLWRRYPAYKPNVVSLTVGENIRSVADNLDFVLSFDEVIVCTDMDEVGRKCAKDIAALVGPKAKIMEMGEKDANDMLRRGQDKEFVHAFFSAKVIKPDGLITIEDCYEEAIELPKWGRKWPWPSLDKLTYGRRDGEGIYVGSAVKSGKTEWLSQMADHIINVEGKRVFLCKFEQDPAQTVKALAGKIKHKQFHNPDHYDRGLFTQEELIGAVEQLRDKVIMFNAGFSDVGHGNMWDRLKPAIRHAVLAEGVKDVFIDPITQLTDGLTASETEQELRRFSNEIQGMAKDFGFFYYCFAHLKEPSTGLTHEEGGPIKVAQFRGSRAMAEKTKLMLGIIRNQFADDPAERNTSTFHLLLNSSFGKPGKFEVFYDEMTGAYLEPRRDRMDF